MFNLIFAIFLALFSAQVYAQKNVGDFDGVVSHFAQKNYVKNPSCFKNTANITASGGSFTRSTTTPIDGGTGSECSFDASASGQTLKFDLKLFEQGLKGQNCEARFSVEGVGSGYYKAYVEQNSSKITSDYSITTNSGDVQIYSMNFPCGTDLSLVTKVVIESTSASAPAMSIGKVYAGLATNLTNVSQASFFGGMEQNGSTSTCEWNESTSTNLADYKDLGTGTGCSAWTTSGNITAQGTNDHRAVASNMPEGEYIIRVQGAFYQNGAFCSWRLSDGTTTYQPQMHAQSATDYYTQLEFHASYTTSGSRTFKLQAADNFTGKCALSGDGGYYTSWKFYRFPAQSQLVTNSPVTFFPTYSAKVSSAGVVSDENSDFINGNCSVANTSEFTCSWNSSQFATAPNCTATPLETGTAAPIVKVFTQATTSSVVVKTYNNSATATAYGFNLICQSTTAASTPTPLFVGSVSSNSSGMEKLERATIVCSSSSSITRQSGSWLTSVGNISTGGCTLTATGFSSLPSCTVGYNAQVSSERVTITAQVNSATSIVVDCSDSSTGAACTSFNAHIICMGPK